MSKKTEERQLAEQLMKEAKSIWGTGWRLLSEHQQYSAVAALFMKQVIAQYDERMYVRFFKQTGIELTKLVYGEE